MNFLKTSIALSCAILCITNAPAKNLDLHDEEEMQEAVVQTSSPRRVKNGVQKLNAKHVTHEINKSQRSTRKAIKRYISSISRSGIDSTSAKRSQYALDSAVAEYCDLLRETSNYIEADALDLRTFKNLEGVNMVTIKSGEHSSLLWPTLTGTAIGFGQGALIGAALPYTLGLSLVIPWGAPVLPLYAASALTVGAIGSIIGATCGLLSTCFHRSPVNEEALLQAEAYLELITEKIQRAEDSLVACL